ncbi:hypothetical protein HDV57DRAFT_26517 [Trichoderma longibrachiatum]|uniref:Uncharacterized protein n=1 Tax=Trichoderma longibrachiatum ATCC 18648 TaxID=983965 RepID=A0A2T4CIB3_TRILO|nr:hypothetical protein M440DRAFT_1012366 [Trichoderma longibrachiatum ATCC 18648]
MSIVHLHCHASCHTTLGAVNAGTCDAHCFFSCACAKSTYRRKQYYFLFIHSLLLPSPPSLVHSSARYQVPQSQAPLALAYSPASYYLFAPRTQRRRNDPITRPFSPQLNSTLAHQLIQLTQTLASVPRAAEPLRSHAMRCKCNAIPDASLKRRIWPR